MQHADSTAATMSDSAAQCLSSTTSDRQGPGAQPEGGSQQGTEGSAPVSAVEQPNPCTGSTATAEAGEADGPLQARSEKAAGAAPCPMKRKVVVYAAYIGAGYIVSPHLKAWASRIPRL